MLRALVVSDSHGDAPSLRRVLELHSEADIVFFLGDGERDFYSSYVSAALVNQKVTAVQGNCDFYSELPKEELVPFAGKRILALHGHTRHAKFGLGEMQTAAEEEYKADIVVYGHTHNQSHEIINEVHYLCPGSIRQGEYAMIDMTDKGEVCCILARL